MALGGLVLGSLILYLKGMRTTMFQLSGFYYNILLEGFILEGLETRTCFITSRAPHLFPNKTCSELQLLAVAVLAVLAVLAVVPQ